MNLVPYNQTKLYENDCIGLKALDQNNSIITDTIANALHMEIPASYVNSTRFLKFILTQ